jgi:hypothetical protein
MLIVSLTRPVIYDANIFSTNEDGILFSKVDRVVILYTCLVSL